MTKYKHLREECQEKEIYNLQAESLTIPSDCSVDGLIDNMVEKFVM